MFFGSHADIVIYYQHDANCMGCDLFFLYTTTRTATEKRKILDFVIYINNYYRFEAVQEF